MCLDKEKLFSTLLSSGKVVAIPTETVYGLAASIHSESAIQCIYSLKNRPADNPLIVHVSSKSQLAQVALPLSPLEEALIDAFWPGSLTLVLKKHESLSDLITAGQSTVAVRMPNHKKTLSLIADTGPLVAPSANISTFPSATQADHVRHDFGDDFPVLDGGTCTTGIESTIVMCNKDSITILREGAISKTDLEQIAPVVLSKREEKTPGTRYLHYAPKTPVEVIKDPSEYHDVVIGYEDRSYACTHLFSLGYAGDPSSIARGLYATLRAVDTQNFSSVSIDTDLPMTDEYTAIHNRFRKLTRRDQQSACR